MKGKIVNLVLGIMNALLGILIIIYSTFIPNDISLITTQEQFVINIINIGLICVFAVITIINIIYVFINKRDKVFRFGYILGLFAISFFFIQKPFIAIFSFMSALIIIIKSIRENIRNIENMIMLSITVTIIGVIIILSGTCCIYKWIGSKIKDKENEGELLYSQEFFKYITELEIDDIYINVKRADGKWGYINQNGDIVIDFKYEYASPFVNINIYNKNFKIALVSDKKSTKVILKNERKVLSYKTESASEDYQAKEQELYDIYKNILLQEGEMQYEVVQNNNIEKRPVYIESTEDYTYRYDYNEEYDVIITESSTGNNKYELAKKSNINIRLPLSCERLSYDSNYLYVYKNGYIPFYNINSKEQGWFNSEGKKTTMQGKAQILEYIDDNNILLKNYNDKTSYFIDKSGNIISPIYKEIYICNDYYIVKNNNNKFMFIDKSYNKILEEEYDIIDTTFLSFNIFICANLYENVQFNEFGFAKLNYEFININGNKLGDYDEIYNLNCKISTDKNVDYNTRYNEFVNQVTKIEYTYVGDEFYKIYN